jgi:hypothetical protein
MTVASAPKVDALDQNEYELLDAHGSKKADGEEARDKSKRGRARTAKVAPPVTAEAEAAVAVTVEIELEEEPIVVVRATRARRK